MKKRIITSVLILAAVAVLITAVNVFRDGREVNEASGVVTERVLIPGGQSVGIRMNVKGVLVVGLEEIETKDDIVNPGMEAGLQLGDMIIEINGEEVYYAGEVADIVNSSQGPLNVRAARKDQVMDFIVEPVTDFQTGEKKIGIWVKEKIAGIGTLSFYDPATNVYAALGHGIYEAKTDTLLEAGEGTLLRTAVSSVKEGSAGHPGEIKGIFYEEEEPIGSVKKNSEFGVYSLGFLSGDEMSEPVVMATQDQIEEGPATMLTTIDGSRVESFDIIISRVNRQKEAKSRGLEIEVTDEKLLSYCGGIVQGMSGSPIIQNGRIIGAVTHVFVDDPKKGYGIFAEWMVEEGEDLS